MSSGCLSWSRERSIYCSRGLTRPARPGRATWIMRRAWLVTLGCVRAAPVMRVVVSKRNQGSYFVSFYIRG